MSGAAFSIQDRVQARLHAAHRWNDSTIDANPSGCHLCRLLASEAMQAVLEDQAQLEQLVRYGRSLAAGDDDRREYVYLFESGGRYKVGTSRDVDARLIQIQRTCPSLVQEIMRVPGGREEEQHLHEYLANYRLHGEWFDLTPLALDSLKLSLLCQYLAFHLDTDEYRAEVDALPPEQAAEHDALLEAAAARLNGEVERRERENVPPNVRLARPLEGETVDWSDFPLVDGR